MRFNPAPGWPPPPKGFTPGPGWRPDPSWPPAPPGWQLWVSDDRVPDDPYYNGGGEPPTYTQYRQAQTQAPPRLSQPPGTSWERQVGSLPPGGSRERQVGSPPSGASRERQVASPPPGGSWERQLASPPSGPSRLAVTSFLLGLFGIVGISAILGIVLGLVALRRMRRTMQRGKGLAIAGIVLGIAWLAVAVVLVATGTIFGSPTPAPSSASGQPVNPFSLITGNCFDNPAVTPGHVTDVGSVVRTTCTKPHNAQIFATFAVSGAIRSYPGSAKLTDLASSGCNTRAKASLDSSMITNSMQIRLLFPLQSSWTAGHRTISCIIYNPTATMKSSVLNH
jgi:hypothetical protein